MTQQVQYIPRRLDTHRMSPTSRNEVARVPGHECIRVACDSDLEKWHIARIGQRDVERPRRDMFGKRRDGIEHSSQISLDETELLPTSHFVVFGENTIVQQENELVRYHEIEQLRWRAERREERCDEDVRVEYDAHDWRCRPTPFAAWAGACAERVTR